MARITLEEARTAVEVEFVTDEEGVMTRVVRQGGQDMRGRRRT